MNIFVTGTDTGIGKTVVSSVLINVLKETSRDIAYFKPIQAGAIIDGNMRLSEDVKEVTRLTGLAHNSGKYCSYILTEPMSPYQAAIKDGIKINIDKIIDDYTQLKRKYDHIVIEGAGGVYVPITEELNMIDLIEMMEASVVLVVRPGLGTINHSLLSLKVLQQRKLNILGFIVNNYPSKEQETNIIRENPGMITKFTGIKCLGKVMESNLPAIDYSINKDFIL